MLVPAAWLALCLLGQGASRPLGPADLPPTSPVFGGIAPFERDLGLTPLRLAALPKGDLELRVWHGFARGTRLVVLERRAETWRLRRTVTKRPDSRKWTILPLEAIAPPNPGWGALWRELDALGVRTIPDEGSLPDDGIRVFDGASTLVEVRTGAEYRAYFYDNPGHHPAKPYAPAVAKIVRVIARAMPDGRF